MAVPTLVVNTLEHPAHITRCVRDPMVYLDRMQNGLDAAARANLRVAGMFAVSDGSRWGALLPDMDADGEVAALRAQYGDKVADELQAARRRAGPHTVLLWKVMLTVPRGRG